MNLKEYKQEFEERGIKVKIDGGLYSEDGQTLYVAPKKQTVHVNEGCKYIAPHAFSMPDRCNTYYSVVLPEGVIEIGDQAFLRCENLCYVTLPSTLKVIGQGAFWQCYKLQKLEIPQGVEQIGEAAIPSNDILSSSQSDFVIADKKLMSCHSQSEVVEIPDGVESIARTSFDRINTVQKIVIPASVKKVEDQAFWECEHLEEMVIKPAKLHLFNAFGWSTTCFPQRIYVPSESIAFYRKMAELWMQRASEHHHPRSLKIEVIAL